MPAFGEGEEFTCAQRINAHPKVLTWLKNNAQNTQESFWLPWANARFYPDFIGQLTDGRIGLFDYKGEQLRNTPDTLEKDAIGRLWAKNSSGKHHYATIFHEKDGRDFCAQLAARFGVMTCKELSLFIFLVN